MENVTGTLMQVTGVPSRSTLWQGRRIACVGVLAALLAAACVPVEPLPPVATNYCVSSPPTTSADYQAMFDGLRTQWTEWAASDGSIPVDLSTSSWGPGTVLWLFGDTIVGRVRANGSIASGWKFIHDSVVLQTATGGGACVTPLMGGARGIRRDFIPNPTNGDWYWPTGGVVENGGTTLRLFMYDVAPDPSQPTPFNWKINQIDVATYSLPDLQLTGSPVRLLPPSLNVTTLYGERVLDGGDGYLYAYGHTGVWTKTDAHHYVARVPIGTETSATPAWEFWNGIGWSIVPTTASPMLFDPDGAGSALPADNKGPYDALDVIPYSSTGPGCPGGPPPPPCSGYLATAKSISAFDHQISTWFATALTGPWSYVGAAKTGQPALPQDPDFTYAAQMTRGLTGSSPMLIWSQNHNPLDPDVINNNQLYKSRYDVPDPAALP
jgi:hypothetical protein